MTKNELRAKAVNVLTSEKLENIVEMVLFSPEPGVFEAHANDGSVMFERPGCDDPLKPKIIETQGRDPLSDQDVSRFSTLALQREFRCPKRTENSYPYSYDHVAQIWDHEHAPDLIAIHTAAHSFLDEGGHLGEHGSLDILQARAPFILSGKGVKKAGVINSHVRLVDVAPSVAYILGASQTGGILSDGNYSGSSYLKRQDGKVLSEWFQETERPDNVVIFLLDGCNPNILYDVVEQGGAPNISRLMANGTTFSYGAISSLPTVTLANHTTILTGCHPAHHGVLHNAWFDRKKMIQIVTESPGTWHLAMDYLNPETETIFECLNRYNRDITTAAINEPADKGATYSTFEEVRKGRMAEIIAQSGIDASVPKDTTNQYFESSQDYRWATTADHAGLAQAIGLIRRNWDNLKLDRPKFMSVNFSLTDSAFHDSGPDSDMGRAAVRDTDARIGKILRAFEIESEFDQTLFIVLADHGMEETNPNVTGSWIKALKDASIDVANDSFGFLYLNS